MKHNLPFKIVKEFDNHILDQQHVIAEGYQCDKKLCMYEVIKCGL